MPVRNLPRGTACTLTKTGQVSTKPYRVGTRSWKTCDYVDCGITPLPPLLKPSLPGFLNQILSLTGQEGGY